jgi:DNA polymerase III alpha subunit
MTTRRDFLKQATGLSLAAILPPHIISAQEWKEDAGTGIAIPLHSSTGAPGLFFGRYEDADQDRLFQRVNHELEILRGLGGAEDSLAVTELVRFACEEGIPLRLRAAGCSSIFPYLLGLSDVDPLRHHLYFERFRDPSGRWAPPFVIQVDNKHLERIRHLADLGYGRDLVRRTISFLPTTTLETIPLLVIDAIRQEGGPAGQLNRIPPDDEAAFRLICRGDTEGLCLLHRGRLRGVMPRLQPASIEDLAAALVQPAGRAGRRGLQATPPVEPSANGPQSRKPTR